MPKHGRGFVGGNISLIQPSFPLESIEMFASTPWIAPMGGTIVEDKLSTLQLSECNVCTNQIQKTRLKAWSWVLKL